MHNIDTEIPQALVDVDDWSSMYSFKQYLKMMVRNLMMIENEELFNYDDDNEEALLVAQQLRSLASTIRQLLEDIRVVIEEAGEYSVQYRRIFGLLN